MALLAVLGAAAAMRRRRGYEDPGEEPWRASLQRDDEPLDVEEIRRAEDEWLEEDGWSDAAGDEEWR